MEDLDKSQDIKELIELVASLGTDSSNAYKSYKQLKEREDRARDMLREALIGSGLLTARTKDVTASIVSKPTIEIRHEQSALEWLKNEPDIETDEFIGLKVTPFKKLALHRLSEKGGGEIIPGTEMVMNQSLAIRKK